MTKKLFTLLLAVAASVGTMFAEKVQIGDLYYNLDATNQTAEVTSQESNYWSTSITTANIPASVEYNSVTYSVTSIGNFAFNGCSSLPSIEIPNSVTSIGSAAFYDCSSLTSIEIPNSVTSIGESAFGGCSGLTSVTIPNSVTSIGSYAFYGCSGLTSITIGENVTSIGAQCFSGCTNITSVEWNAKNYADFTSTTTPFYSDGSDVCGKYDIYSTNCKDSYRFDLRPQITSFTFGDVVEHIPAYLCTGMSNLASVTIGNRVTSIGDFAFGGCTGLTSVTIPNSVTSLGEYAFSSCTGLTSVTIPNSVTSLGEYAFSSCTGLTSITIHNGVTSIGGYAFYGCSGLTEIIVPESVTRIGNAAFVHCESLKTLKVLNKDIQVEAERYEMFVQSTALKQIKAPACIFDIPADYTSYPSYFPQKLDSIEVTNGELSENALWSINLSRKTLKSIDVSATTHTELIDEAFNEFYNLQTLKLLSNLTQIGYKMVAECVKLKSIDIPAAVTEIADRAFEDCRSIETITFGGASAPAPGRFNAPAATSQLKRIGNWAFYNAHELQHLTIPEGVTEIGDGAFYGCTYLEDLTLPSSVQSVGDNCFALCAKMNKIVVNSTTPPTIQAKTFYDVKRQIPVYVPDECVNSYKSDALWGEFDIQGISQMPQGIDNVSSSLQGGDRGRLILRDGQIFILRGEKTYTVTGQEVK